MQRWRVATAFLLVVILAFAIVQYVSTATHGEWEVSNEWTIGDEWILGGELSENTSTLAETSNVYSSTSSAIELDIENFEGTLTSGVRPFAVAVIELGGASEQTSTRYESVGVSASVFMTFDNQSETIQVEPPTRVGSVTVDTGEILRSRYNNFSLEASSSLDFMRVVSQPQYLWMDQSYEESFYTQYCLYARGSTDQMYYLDRWFPTANSTGQLRIISPLSTNIELGFYSPHLISAWAEGVVSYTWLSENQTLRMVANSDVNPIIIHATVTQTEINIPPELIDVEITDMEGCGNWVFSEEQYYHFRATYWDGDGYGDIAYAKLTFTDSVNWVAMVYYGTPVTDTPYAELENGSDYVRLGQPTVSYPDENTLQIVFEVYFRNTIIDAHNRTIWLRAIDDAGADTRWVPMAVNYFHIYNLGGHSELSSSGSAGRMTGGDIFELYAYNGSSVSTNITFRNLQHVKIRPKVIIDNVVGPGGGYPNGTISYYMDYCTDDDDWITGFRMELDPIEAWWGSVRYHNWTARFYIGDTLVKSQHFNTFEAGGVWGNVTVDLWIDLWFNKENASSTWGARVNAYYFPMVNNANPWLQWLTGGNWGPLSEARKESMCFSTLLDDSSNVLHAQQIKLVRFGCAIDVNQTDYEQYIELTDYEVFDLTISDTHSPFIGVQTPVFDETKVPLMPQGGFLGTLWSALVSLGRIIADALGPPLLNLWDVFVGFLDTVAGLFGYPTFFSDLFDFLANAATWFVNSLGYIQQLLVSVFALASEAMEGIIFTVVTVSGVWVNMLRSMFQFLGNTFNTGINIWEDLGGVWWLTIGAILYPLYLLILWEDQGLDAVINQVTFLFNVASFIGHGLITVVQFILNIIGRIIESIPVVE